MAEVEKISDLESSSLAGRACRFLDRDDFGIICRTDHQDGSRVLSVITLRPDGAVGVYADIPEWRVLLEPTGSENERFVRAGVRGVVEPLLNDRP